MDTNTQNITSFNGSMDAEGNIFSIDFLQGRKLVGASLARVKELENALSSVISKAEEYEKMLIDAGILKKKMTPEEQVEALTEKVEKLTACVAALLEERKDNGWDKRHSDGPGRTVGHREIRERESGSRQEDNERSLDEQGRSSATDSEVQHPDLESSGNGQYSTKRISKKPDSRSVPKSG